MSREDDIIESLLHERRIFDPPVINRDTAYIGDSQIYEQTWKRSMENMEEFWGEVAENFIDWSERWTRVLSVDLEKPEVRWFDGGRLNVSYNCLDRHLQQGRKNKAAIIWQGEKDDEVRIYTYQMLHTEVCRFANVLKKHGVSKGDRVVLYLPMIPELVIAMLACTRIGAIHSVIFSGFSTFSLRNRIQDCQAKILITADNVVRAGRHLPLKSNADKALEECSCVKSCIVVRRTGGEVTLLEGRDHWWHKEVKSSDISSVCDPVAMESEDPLFILYTSGSTGKPKGVVHTTGGYLVFALYTCQCVFDIKDDDIYWCTADIGWITGHSYILYGPLGLGATSLMFEGIPSFPGPDRYWQVVEKFRVTIFYTAPTVIRALMRYGNEPADIHEISSLRILGSVGEPINPEAWMWYHQVIGQGRLPIVDTWWQTETGGILISPLPYATRLKPGSATRPLPGIDAVILDENGIEVEQNEGGRLVIRKPWPGMFRGVYGDMKQYKDAYFKKYPGMYDTGDGARCDEDDYFWIMGRLDDVINVAGHRLGTAEVESALVAHPSVAEAAVVGMPHKIKGQAIYAYITVNEKISETAGLLVELREYVRKEIGPIATPDVIQYAPGLPKTRSGKIMRRVLRKIAADDFDNFGDTSTLADPSVIEDLIEGKKHTG